jgi:phosphate transport system substrate-binding protein
VKRVLLAAAAAIAIGVPVVPAHADGPTVNGAGSTWSQNAIDQWRADVAKNGININYQGVGSSAGRTFFINNQTDFAVSEIPFESDEVASLQQENKSYVYLPIVAGGTSFMYNIRDAAGNRIRDLRLSGNTLGKIFTKKITFWDDPAVTSDNNGRVLPHTAIQTVARSDGSGTTAQFTTYLWKQYSSIWCPFAQANGIDPCRYTSNWPTSNGFQLQSGSDGVANYVANDSTGSGAITYVETSYALQRGFPVAAMKNQSGAYTLPTSRNVAIALTKAKINADHTQNLDGVYVNPDPSTYPVSSYSYMIEPTTGFDPAKGAVLGKFILYFACTGQRKADQLGYSPLPPNLVKIVFDAEQQMPGAPKPPQLSKCDNPTIQGGFGSVSNSTGGSLSSAPGATSGGAGAPSGSSGGSHGGASGSGGGSGGTSTGNGAVGGAGSSIAGGGGAYGPAGGSSGGNGTLGGGGIYGSGGASNLALPTVKVRSKPPGWLPLATLALIVLLLIVLPPVFAITGAGRKHRSD